MRSRRLKLHETVCLDCNGTGEIVGTPGSNGLALAAQCPTCNGTGKR
jgi:DnaJ-class molecular chaperone